MIKIFYLLIILQCVFAASQLAINLRTTKRHPSELKINLYVANNEIYITYANYSIAQSEVNKSKLTITQDNNVVIFHEYDDHKFNDLPIPQIVIGSIIGVCFLISAAYSIYSIYDRCYPYRNDYSPESFSFMN